MTRYWVKGLTGYLLRHPSGILPVLRSGWRLRRNRWWAKPPFLPLPATAYWSFRLSTVGGVSGELDPRGVVAAAKWSLRQPTGN